MSSNFRYQHFVTVSGILGGKVPLVDDVFSSNEKKIHLITALDENCIELEIQTDRNNYVVLTQTYLALKQKILKGRS